MSFTGRPGTGKTTVAMRMAKILHHLGYVRKGHLVVATRDDLVGQYVGHTAPKTKEMLKKAIGGVLFIDEAYYLYRPENERDYGQEAIEMLLQAMENQRGDSSSSWPATRNGWNLLPGQPGLPLAHRPPHRLPGLQRTELMQIAELMVRQQNYAFDPAARQAFANTWCCVCSQPHFANARSVRNALDRIKLRQANRLVRQGGMISREELMRIDASDMRQSRVFQGRVERKGELSMMRGKRPIIIGIVGDSAAGKTTISRGLVKLLGPERVTHVCTDDYHKYDRRERAELGITALHPDCNYLDIMELHLERLHYGQPILKPVYDHATGTLVRPEYVQARAVRDRRGPAGLLFVRHAPVLRREGLPRPTRRPAHSLESQARHHQARLQAAAGAGRTCQARARFTRLSSARSAGMPTSSSSSTLRPVRRWRTPGRP